MTSTTETSPAESLPRDPLRVLIANETAEHLPAITDVVLRMGHTVVAAGIDVEAIGEATRQELPDVALVGLGLNSEHALRLISKVVHESACPVIALLHNANPDFVNEAAKRGIFAYLTDGDMETLQSALDIVLRRFAEYQNLEGAFGRRATIERAKGILMAVHRISEQQAFDMLRSQSQRSGRKLLDLAEAVIDGHELLIAARDNSEEPPLTR